MNIRKCKQNMASRAWEDIIVDDFCFVDSIVSSNSICGGDRQTRVCEANGVLGRLKEA